jgi:hypothetical protein
MIIPQPFRPTRNIKDRYTTEELRRIYNRNIRIKKLKELFPEFKDDI